MSTPVRPPSTSEISSITEAILAADAALANEALEEKERQRRVALVGQQFQELQKNNVDLGKVYRPEHDSFIEKAKQHQIVLPAAYAEASAQRNFVEAGIDRSGEVKNVDLTASRKKAVEELLGGPEEVQRARSAWDAGGKPVGLEDNVEAAIFIKSLTDAPELAGAMLKDDIARWKNSSSERMRVQATELEALLASNQQGNQLEEAFRHNPIVRSSVGILLDSPRLIDRSVARNIQRAAAKEGKKPSDVRAEMRAEMLAKMEGFGAELLAKAKTMQEIPDPTYQQAGKAAEGMLEGKVSKEEGLGQIKEGIAAEQQKIADQLEITDPGISKILATQGLDAAVRAARDRVLIDPTLPPQVKQSLAQLQEQRVKSYFEHKRILDEIDSLINSNLPIELVVMLVMQKFHQLAEVQVKDKMREQHAAESIAAAKESRILSDGEEKKAAKLVQERVEKLKEEHGRSGGGKFELPPAVLAQFRSEAEAKVISDRAQRLGSVANNYGVNKSAETVALETQAATTKMKQMWDIWNAVMRVFQDMVSTPTRNIR